MDRSSHKEWRDDPEIPTEWLFKKNRKNTYSSRNKPGFAENRHTTAHIRNKKATNKPKLLLQSWESDKLDLESIETDHLQNISHTCPSSPTARLEPEPRSAESPPKPQTRSGSENSLASLYVTMPLSETTGYSQLSSHLPMGESGL